MLAKTTIDLKYKPSRAEADVVVKLNGFMYDRDGEAERLCVSVRRSSHTVETERLKHWRNCTGSRPAVSDAKAILQREVRFRREH